MTNPVDVILVLAILLNFLALGTAWLRACIRAAAGQGLLLAVLPLAIHPDLPWHAVALAAVTALLKGVLIPAMLFKALRDVHIRHEMEPYVGYITSLFLCALGTALAVVFGGSLPLATEHVGTLFVPASLATLLSGFLILVTRRKALTQVVGYLILENGIFIFGLLLLAAMPFMVEIGVLLDLLVGIFIMGIVINHIQREFSSLDTERLSELRD